VPNHEGVKVALIRDLGALDASGLGPDAQPHLFDRLGWFHRTWDHCRPGVEPLVAHAVQGPYSAWLFLARTDRQGAIALSSWYTLAFRPVFAGNPADSDQIALLRAIACALKRSCASVSLDKVPRDSATLLATAFRDTGWTVFCRPGPVNWTEDVAGRSFADYWAARPGQLRSTVKRKRTKAALDIRIDAAFEEAAWADYADVYADSWKPEEGSLAFLRATAESKGGTGNLRLGIARLQGRAVAAQLWTVEHGIATIHKLAHRRGFDAISPGTLLTHAMFEHVIDRDRVARIDFGTGDDRYKADWMSTRNELSRLDCYNRGTLSGLVGAARQLAARALGR